MISTSSKIAFGFILLISLLLGAVGYIYQEMNLLTAPSALETNINTRRKITNQIISQLYDAEIIGQTLRSGKIDEFHPYLKAMRKASASIDTLQLYLTDTLQQARLDTVRGLLREKEKNMIAVLEAMADSPAEALYQAELDSLLNKQDSLLRAPRIQKKIITHRNTYTIHHKKKGFFKRLAEVFSPGKNDSTQVNNIIREEYADTISEVYNPIDTIVNLISDIRGKVFDTQQQQQRTLLERINKLRIAGSELSLRVTQLLESIETDEQEAAFSKIRQEQEIRNQAAQTIEIIATIAVVLSLIFFIIIWRDLTRSSHYRKELEKSKLYAENLLAAREKLMLTITHDIKAPAGSIIGYIDLLVRLTKDRRQQLYLTNMKSSAQHLLELITSLLDFHRLEAGKMDLQQVAFHPDELFNNIFHSFLPLAEKKGIALTFDERVPEELVLEGDPFRIRQIAENLLSNALKFTSKGNIRLRVNYQGNRFTFSIQDTGCGMTHEEQTRIFQEFTRLQSAQGQEGFGLGLSISKKLVELANGTIHIDSIPKQGSTFTVSLPLPHISTSNSGISKNDKLLPNARMHILLVDDDSIQLHLTQAIILNTLVNDETSAEKKPLIVCCQQPEEAIQILKSQSIDIVFTDIQMPTLNGFELLQQIRQLQIPHADTLPVIAITARGDLDEKDFQAKGFSGMLQKPFNQSDILQIFTRLFSVQPVSDSSETPATETPEHKEEVPTYTYQFTPLTAFSENDPEAATEIMKTFIQETYKNIQSLQEALQTKDPQQLCAIAHKMLPTFTMIEAKEIIPTLQEMDRRRKSGLSDTESETYTALITNCAQKVIQEAEHYCADLRQPQITG
ncbi:ATP-binding protein [uncultured Phocaeicola sp.]|uniref:hybrid sensor histidine kinase/response regulator n=1 Tax=uncultured Phocaeicola sp. TaxID=990718 RepID=UPI0025D46A88|nr:ATP-binding protein [uncultured Phocaeicola sp.]